MLKLYLFINYLKNDFKLYLKMFLPEIWGFTEDNLFLLIKYFINLDLLQEVSPQIVLIDYGKPVVTFSSESNENSGTIFDSQ